jgi:hypothetical protein
VLDFQQVTRLVSFGAVSAGRPFSSWWLPLSFSARFVRPSLTFDREHLAVGFKAHELDD